MTEQMTEQAAPAEAAVQTDAPKWAPEAEQEARALGWKAPDEWKGEIPAGYIDDPTRYLERAESFAPFRKIREKLSEVEKSSQEALRKIENASARMIERERERHTQELSRIKAEKVAAVETGDVQAFKALDAQEDAIRKQLATPEPAKQDSAVPDSHRVAIENWAVERPWFKKDAVKTQAAATFYGEAQAEGISDPGAILKFVDRRMSETFADLAPKQRDSAVESGLTLGSGAKPGAFETLPKEAKDSFRKYVERGVVEDTKEARAQWAEDYNA